MIRLQSLLGVFALLAIAWFLSENKRKPPLRLILVGLKAMVPERRDEIVSLGLRAIVAGTITTCLTGAVIGIIY